MKYFTNYNKTDSTGAQTSEFWYKTDKKLVNIIFSNFRSAYLYNNKYYNYILNYYVLHKHS